MKIIGSVRVINMCAIGLLVFISQWGTDFHGVNGGNVKKVMSQISAFQEYGFNVKPVIKEIPHHNGTPGLIDRVSSKSKNFLPFCTNNAIVKYDEVGKADFYYIRFRAYDFYFYQLIKQIKENNPNSKLVLEYSDYPYLFFRGTAKISDFLVAKRDAFNKKRTLKYVDRIATLLKDANIDGKETLRIFNGIDMSKIKINKHDENDGEINVLVVASLQTLHGVDRFIKGMKNYYNNEKNRNIITKIILHVVGDGSCLEDLKKEAAGMGDKVIFYGFLHGDELEQIYDKADLGIEFLAPHRRDVWISASLKSREYIAKGIPFITACKLDIEDLGYREFLRVEDSEEPINMNEVIEYYKYYIENKDNIRMNMRKFAEKYLSMSFAMKTVTDYFKKTI